jgi:Family of unknown function (DUF6400)
MANCVCNDFGIQVAKRARHCDICQVPNVTEAIAGRSHDRSPWWLDRLFVQGEPVAVQPNTVAFAYDLTLDEARRRAAVLEAIRDDWDPLEVMAEEDRAYAMLYSGLDDEQQRLYDDLVTAGVLPDRTVGRVPD